MTTIDDLLANARVTTTPSAGFDVGLALHRLAADACAAVPTDDMHRATQARQRLSVVCRWIVNRPDAADRVDRLARASDPPDDESADGLDAYGALVFACVLHLTDHRESAQFWWQLAWGAGRRTSRTAAYCLHLHHASLGEMREARHWLHQVTDSVSHSQAPDEAFLALLENVAAYVHRTGITRATSPSGGLEMEVDRLAAAETSRSIIVERPDRRFAARLHELISR